MAINLNFNNAPEQRSFDLIPAKTQVPVIAHIRAGGEGDERLLKSTDSGLWMLTLELTVTEGEYAKRKLFTRLFLDHISTITPSEGQKTAIASSNATMRAIIEAMRGIDPKDTSAAAMEARKINSLMDINGAEFWIEIGIEKGKDGREDQNRVNSVLHLKPGQTRPEPRPPAGAGAGAANRPTANGAVGDAATARWAS